MSYAVMFLATVLAVPVALGPILIGFHHQHRRVNPFTAAG